jgi:hypothetical protein
MEKKNEHLFSLAVAVLLILLTAVVSTTLWLSVRQTRQSDCMTRDEIRAYIDSVLIEIYD